MNTPKLYTYIMTVDSGLAPNPFWGYCTLAVCTPNHQGCRAKAGDYIAGFTTKREGYRLIYMMQVCEKLRMDKYSYKQSYLILVYDLQLIVDYQYHVLVLLPKQKQ